MVSEELITLIAGAAVTIVLCIPAYLARRIKHGEARFKDGKLVDDE